MLRLRLKLRPTCDPLNVLSVTVQHSEVYIKIASTLELNIFTAVAFPIILDVHILSIARMR